MADPDRLVPGVIVRVGWIGDTPPRTGIIREVFTPGLNTDHPIAYYNVLDWPRALSHFAAVYASHLEIIYDR